MKKAREKDNRSRTSKECGAGALVDAADASLLVQHLHHVNGPLVQLGA